MQPEHPVMLAQTIQLALAPVFVLVAIGNIMNILTARLARMVDRSRHLQALHGGTMGSEHDGVVTEMRVIDRRIAHIGRALLCLVISGLAIGTTVAALFLSELAGADLGIVIAATFVLAIALLMVALVLLLLETRLAAKTLRLPPELLELERGDL
ncbi:DUF2721 domain-containing protein [Novosphingobium sp. AAP93]|uniref:DUF2721 domain-containing protein n=1 Tax=Novosphingobium sp. AAP93 TaxID=1523427 RepID=UPI001E629493|nr:DUF2721 domain-containing protein [Novosphingobium sp. AAP93]